ncbi:MAG: ATPase [Bacteroidales bacterium]|nr:ATPase [Bacteroidales bacterium]
MSYNSTLIIDAGSTKTEWVVASAGSALFRFVTAGINPNYLDDEAVAANISEFAAACPAELAARISAVDYYGSGCAAAANVARMENLLRRRFSAARLFVASDLLGACRALCNDTQGIVAILGTGAAACLYDGSDIVSRAPSLGYMLGDEGSGTHLGKMFITEYLLGTLPADVKNDFEAEFSIDAAAIIRKVYREPAPNRFMASLPPFIAKYVDNPVIFNFCKSCFDSFIQKQIFYFFDYQKYTLNIIGSVGFHFQKVIRECASENKIIMGAVNASPMPALIAQTK